MKKAYVDQPSWVKEREKAIAIRQDYFCFFYLDLPDGKGRTRINYEPMAARTSELMKLNLNPSLFFVLNLIDY